MIDITHRFSRCTITVPNEIAYKQSDTMSITDNNGKKHDF